MAMVLAGCASGDASRLLQPTAARRAPTLRPRNTLVSSTGDNGKISVYDDSSGYTFVVDPIAKTIKRDDGLTGVLDSTTVAFFENTFLDIVNGDGQTNTLENAPPPTSDCGLGGYCDQAVPQPGNASVAIRANTLTSGPTYPGTSWGVRILGAGRLRFHPTAGGGNGGGGVQTQVSVETGPTCVDIANSIYTATQNWRASRQAVMTDVKALFKITPTLLLPDGTLAIKVPALGTLDVNLQTAAVQENIDYLTLNILATMYHDNGCMSNMWVDQTGTLSGNSAALVYACHSESGWEISYDGGATWYPIDVTVCEYEWQQI